jgi:hypothetical protein
MEENKETIFEEENETELVAEPEQFLEPEEQAETHEDSEIKIQAGEQEADVYTEEGREELVADDEISPSEEGFSEGAEGKGQLATCGSCDAVLGDENVIEKEVDGNIVFFCSEECANKN